MSNEDQGVSNATGAPSDGAAEEASQKGAKASPAVKLLKKVLGSFLGTKIADKARESPLYSIKDIMAALNAKDEQQFLGAIIAAYENMGSGAGYFQLDDTEKIIIIASVLGKEGIDQVLQKGEPNPEYQECSAGIRKLEAAKDSFEAAGIVIPVEVSDQINTNIEAAKVKLATIVPTIKGEKKTYRKIDAASALNLLYRVSIYTLMEATASNAASKNMWIAMKDYASVNSIAKNRAKSSAEGEQPRAKVLAQNIKLL